MILYLSTNLGDMHGLGQSGIDVLVALLENDKSVTVCTKDANKVIPHLTNFSTKVPILMDYQEKIPFQKGTKRTLPQRILQYFKNRNSFQTFLSQIQNLYPDLCVVNSLGSHEMWMSIKHNLATNPKSVLIVRESPRHFKKPHRRSLDYGIEAVKNYSYLMFVSSRCRDEWADLANLNRDKLLYIPNCCREDLVKQVRVQNRLTIREKLGLPKNELIAVCVASLQPRKGQDILIDVCPKILSIVPNLKLYLIGKTSFDANWSKSLLKKITSSDWRDHVEYLGPKDNALEFIYGADVLVLPSRAEAMPRVILEAMALGTPVIASDVDGVSELIEDGKSGFLFSPDDPPSLVSAFQAWKNELNNIDGIIENAEEKYWNNFSRKQQIKRYEQAVSYMLDN